MPLVVPPPHSGVPPPLQVLHRGLGMPLEVPSPHSGVPPPLQVLHRGLGMPLTRWPARLTDGLLARPVPLFTELPEPRRAKATHRTVLPLPSLVPSPRSRDPACRARSPRPPASPRDDATTQAPSPRSVSASFASRAPSLSPRDTMREGAWVPPRVLKDERPPSAVRNGSVRDSPRVV